MEVGEDYTIVQVGTKTIQSANGNAASKWARKEIKGLKTFDAPQMKSAINVKSNGNTMRGRMIPDSLGYMFNGGNNVESNTINISLLSSCYTMGNGFSIIPANFRKVIALFCARKSIVPNWINCKDEYLAPNTNHPDYEQWNNDCIVYSLFNNSSQQSSLRNIDYKNKIWNIINHFFFMSTKEMLELANKHNFIEMYQDAKAVIPDNRYVYTLLETTSLSNDSKAVLEAARELIRKSMIIRKVYHQNNPQYHLNCFDAGFAQIKPLLKEFYKEEYDAFVKMYKDMENRLREGVYKFGFLLK